MLVTPSPASAEAAEPIASGSLGPGFPRSIRWKVTGLVAALVVLTGAVLTLGGFLYTRQLLWLQSNELLRVIASDRAELLHSAIREYIVESTQIASRTNLRRLIYEHGNQTIKEDVFREETRRILEGAAEDRKSLGVLAITDVEGVVITATDPTWIGRDLSASEAVIQGREASVLVDPYRSTRFNESQVGTPVRGLRGELTGVLIVNVSLARLTGLLDNPSGLRRTGDVVVAAPRDNQIAVLLPSRQRIRPMNLASERWPAMQRAFERHYGTVRTRDARGRPVLAAFQPVGYRDWVLVAQIDVAEALEPISLLRRSMLLAQAALLVFGIGTAYALSRGLTQPVIDLTRSASRVAAGQWNTRVPVSSSDELGELAEAFNAMTEEVAGSYSLLEERVRERTSDLERSQHAVQEQTALLQSVLDAVADGVVAATSDGQFLIFNPSARAIIGRGAAEVDPDRWTSHYGLFDPERLTPLDAQELPLLQASRGECVDGMEILVRNPEHPEGVLISVNARPLLGEGGAINGGVAVFRDITQQRDRDSALQRTAEELKRTNTQLQQIAGDMVVLAAAERQSRLRLQETHEELKKAESQLIQSEKLSSLGQLVAGVAHEVNNPLSFVSNNLAVLERDVRYLRQILDLYRRSDATLAGQDPHLHGEIRELAEQIDLTYTLENLGHVIGRSREGLRRIESIVRDLRDFARLDSEELHAVDLNQGVRSSINIIAGLARKQNVTIEQNLSQLPEIVCQPGKINQVILNLLVNALDACSEGGLIRVATRAVGSEVELSIADNGSGISPEIRSRIFDPFFTTKPVGQGTGLGLSISYGIIQAHVGRIDVESTVGEGSCFRILLPIRPAGADDPPHAV